MFIKTVDNDIVGVIPTSRIYWEYHNYSDTLFTKECRIMCNDIVLKRYTSESKQRNVKNAKEDLSKIFEALKNKEETYKM